MGCAKEKENPIQENFVDWVHALVTWKGYSYVYKDETVPASTIGEKIGEVDAYDNQGSRGYNDEHVFSNRYPVGSELFQLKDVPESKSITVLHDGVYYKLDNSQP
ncbi:hypothetical protein [Paenibacillus baekrokdamisoli]|nr:hypothetical protein [Paenibacillus baekrokdamisoli]